MTVTTNLKVTYFKSPCVQLGIVFIDIFKVVTTNSLGQRGVGVVVNHGSNKIKTFITKNTTCLIILK